jgi:hypothetical protein
MFFCNLFLYFVAIDTNSRVIVCNIMNRLVLLVIFFVMQLRFGRIPKNDAHSV